MLINSILAVQKYREGYKAGKEECEKGEKGHRRMNQHQHHHHPHLQLQHCLLVVAASSSASASTSTSTTTPPQFAYSLSVADNEATQRWEIAVPERNLQW